MAMNSSYTAVYMSTARLYFNFTRLMSGLDHSNRIGLAVGSPLAPVARLAGDSSVPPKPVGKHRTLDCRNGFRRAS